MDKIDKFLRKLRPQELDCMERVIDEIYSGEWKMLNIKKLKGFSNLYRVRSGRIRVVFELLSSSPVGIKIYSVDNRNDNTYNNL
ncbi:MAG: hypothetical protein HZA94_01005 [Candidatus Vogelbacteria bacterium]|nr:hypothetical protein [Candidatus Vogelbacteria bacterium]